MATKDTQPGLLARVANFVRTPADAPSRDLDQGSEDGESGKQAIKRMIERRAHNDAVRHREFSQLRKLREASPTALSELAARASFYLDSSSFPVSEERATTLKKIDEIEAQMSKQWWKGHQGASAEPATASAPAPARPAPVLDGPASESERVTCNTFAPTLLTHLGEPLASGPTQAVVPGAVVRSHAGVTPTRDSESTRNREFSSARTVSIDLDQTLADPVLEDAAIRFANSDDAGAEAVLLVAINGSGATPASKDTWTRALLDMYRSTGQLASYERLALDYAQRTDPVARRPHTLRQLPRPVPPSVGAASPGTGATDVVLWLCPAVLDSAALARLQACVATRHSHYCLAWRALTTITPEAAVALAGTMAQWCEQPLSLQMDNLDVLDALLRVNTPVGDRQVARFWWLLRLNTLRVLGLQDDFELVSMDYCVTYEVSPPTWQSPRCRGAQGPLAAAKATGPDRDEPLEETVRMALTEATPLPGANAARVELAGDILGALAAGLSPLQAALQGSGHLLVSCDGLVRVDFSAAGSILNWVASAQAAGKNIEFCRLPHLVAAFFDLIGINEHARVTTRAN